MSTNSGERYVLRGIDLGRDKLEVINLLGLKQQLEAVRKVSQLVKEIQPVILKTSEGVQTDVHAIPTLIDPNYKWNVWDWKRQAILLANISSCQTHGTQSYNSQSREHIRVQTYSPREIGVQTKKDNYTNAPTLSNFIYGLRGTKENVHHVITLTRPVDE